MTNIEKIGKIEVIALFITIGCNNIIINLPSILLDFTGTGSWLNIIYITILVLIFTLLICKFFKPFVDCDILDVSEYLGKNFLKVIIGVLYIILFVMLPAIYLRYFSHNLQMIYYNDIPLAFIMLFLLVPAIIASKHGLRAISGANLIFIPIVSVGIFTLFFFAAKDFAWENLFPIFGYGVKETFLTHITNVFGFTVLAYLFFIKPFLKGEDNFKTISIVTVVLHGIFLLVSIISLLMTFSFIPQIENNLALHLLTRLIDFGKFLQRVDAIFVFIWILSIVSFLSFNLFLAANIVKKLCNLSSSHCIVYPISALVFSLAISFKDISIIKNFFKYGYKFYSIFLIFIISFIVMLLGYLKKKKQGGYV